MAQARGEGGDGIESVVILEYKSRLRKPTRIWVRCCTPVIPARDAEAGGSLS